MGVMQGDDKKKERGIRAMVHIPKEAENKGLWG
jgi:hypothetical protein